MTHAGHFPGTQEPVKGASSPPSPSSNLGQFRHKVSTKAELLAKPEREQQRTPFFAEEGQPGSSTRPVLCKDH